MSFSIDDVLEALKIIRECNDSELYMEIGDVKLSVFKGDIADSSRISVDFPREVSNVTAKPVEKAADPVAQNENKPAETAPAPTTAVPADKVIPEGLVPIRAAVTSVFWRRPSPEEPPFVEVGSEVKESSVVCLLEVMKCFTSITAGLTGKIEEICVENAQLVEKGTVLFLIRPLKD